MKDLDSYITITQAVPDLIDQKIFSQKTKQYLHDLNQIENSQTISSKRKTELLDFLTKLADYHFRLAEERQY